MPAILLILFLLTRNLLCVDLPLPCQQITTQMGNFSQTERGLVVELTSGLTDPSRYDRAFVQLHDFVRDYVERRGGSLEAAQRPAVSEIGRIAMDTVLAANELLRGRENIPADFLQQVILLVEERLVGARRGRYEFIELVEREIDGELALERRRALLPFIPRLHAVRQEVMRLWAEGLSTSEIASRLSITGDRVDNIRRACIPRLEQFRANEEAGVSQRFEDTLGRMSQRRQRVMELRMQGFSFDEIALQLGEPSGTVTWLILRTEQDIRFELNRPSNTHRELYLRIIASLPADRQRVMQLHAEGRTNREIADATGRTINAVGNLIHTVNERIENALSSVPQSMTPVIEARFIAMASLPIQERRVLELTLRGRTIPQIARTLRITQAIARKRLTDARAAVGDRLGPVEATPIQQFYDRVIPFLEGRPRLVMERRRRGEGPSDIARALGIQRYDVDNVIRLHERNFNNAFENWPTGRLNSRRERELLALAQFNALQRRAVFLHLDGQSNAEIAAAIGRNLNVTSNLVSRGMASLRAILDRAP